MFSFKNGMKFHFELHSCWEMSKEFHSLEKWWEFLLIIRFVKLRNLFFALIGLTITHSILVIQFWALRRNVYVITEADTILYYKCHSWIEYFIFFVPLLFIIFHNRDVVYYHVSNIHECSGGKKSLPHLSSIIWITYYLLKVFTQKSVNNKRKHIHQTFEIFTFDLSLFVLSPFLFQFVFTFFLRWINIG